MAKKPKKQKKNLWLRALTFSILLHVFIIAMLFVYSARFMADHKKNPQPITVRLSKKPKASEQKRKLPLVNLENRVKNKKPKDAKALAESDQLAKKEQLLPLKSQAQSQQWAPPTRKNQTNSTSASKLKRYLKASPKKTAEVLKPGSLELDLRGQTLAQKHLLQRIPSIAEGESNNLNTWRWRHATFFNRVRSAIGQAWTPHKAIKKNDPKGVHLGISDRISRVFITMDRSGKVVGLALKRGCGLEYLDSEAMRAIKEAAPFLYPPAEIFKDKDLFSFTFSFHLSFNKGRFFDFGWR